MISGVTLTCGRHQCRHRCHQLVDHSKMKCEDFVQQTCSQGHKSKVKCHLHSTGHCTACERETLIQERCRERNEKLDRVREDKQRAHALRMAEIQNEIAHNKRILKEQREEKDRENAIRQSERDLSNMRQQVTEKVENVRVLDQNTFHSDKVSKAAQQCKHAEVSSTSSSVLGGDWYPDSDAKDDWEHRKSHYGEENEFLDELMGMIGLEEVKEQFMSIKDRIDLAVRQDIDLKNERLSVSLLGNPGTGKFFTSYVDYQMADA